MVSFVNIVVDNQRFHWSGSALQRDEKNETFTFQEIAKKVVKLDRAIVGDKTSATIQDQFSKVAYEILVGREASQSKIKNSSFKEFLSDLYDEEIHILVMLGNEIGRNSIHLPQLQSASANERVTYRIKVLVDMMLDFKPNVMPTATSPTTPEIATTSTNPTLAAVATSANQTIENPFGKRQRFIDTLVKLHTTVSSSQIDPKQYDAIIRDLYESASLLIQEFYLYDHTYVPFFLKRERAALERDVMIRNLTMPVTHAQFYTILLNSETSLPEFGIKVLGKDLSLPVFGMEVILANIHDKICIGTAKFIANELNKSLIDQNPFVFWRSFIEKSFPTEFIKPDELIIWNLARVYTFSDWGKVVLEYNQFCDPTFRASVEDNLRMKYQNVGTVLSDRLNQRRMLINAVSPSTQLKTPAPASVTNPDRSCDVKKGNHNPIYLGLAFIVGSFVLNRLFSLAKS